MLEWMHDPFVVEHMQTNFLSKTFSDCANFINYSCNIENINMAIVDDVDNYMGTVSLKHITKENAEFAIVMHKNAIGKGYAIWGMREILRMAFNEYNVNYVYWCVNEKNKRAVKFYDKNGWKKVKPSEITILGYTQEQIDLYLWYKAIKTDM